MSQKMCDLGAENKIDARAYGSLLLHCMALRPDKGQFAVDDEDMNDLDRRPKTRCPCTEPIIAALEKTYSSQSKEHISALVTN